MPNSARFTPNAARTTGVLAFPSVQLLDVARRLLSDSGLSLKRITRRCGFGSEETLRNSFLRQLAVTPRDYRTRFSGDAFG